MDEKRNGEEQLEYGGEKISGLEPNINRDVEGKEGLRALDDGVATDQVVSEFDTAEGRRILRKIDIRLVPLLAFLYLVAYVDRGNIGNAKIAGMETDLHLTGSRYNIALTVFFVPYCLLEVPSNIMLKLLKPSLWISIICFLWGVDMTLMGVVSTYKGLYIARFFLGVAEAGFFPAATYLLTLWYQRYEVQRRMAVFYASASLSGAFSGLLAFAIEHMAGIAGLNGWKWIFILEGLVPVAIAFPIYFLLPDSPETARFLTGPEKEFIINRIAVHTGSGRGRVTNADKIQLHHIRAAFSEWKTWLSVVPFWSITVGTYGFTATVPTVVEQLGYSSANAQLMTVPIYLFATLTTLGVAFLSDHYKQRTPFILGGIGFAALGFIAELAIPHPKYPGVTYFFLFFVAGGLYCPFVSIVTLTANNLAPSSKRAVGMAIMISIGNLGGICGSNIYLARQKPKYQDGFGVSLGFCVIGLIATWILRVAFDRENKKRDRLLEEVGEQGLRDRYSEQELLDLGDRSPFFRYTL